MIRRSEAKWRGHILMVMVWNLNRIENNLFILKRMEEIAEDDVEA